MKKTTKRLALNKQTVRVLATGLEGVNGGTIPFPTTITPNSRNCGSFAAQTCNTSVDIACPTDNCGPSVHNSPEC